MMRRINVRLASAMNGRNTNTGNHAGHELLCQPAIPQTAARNPRGTEPTSPRKILAGGKLKTSSGSIAAGTASINDASAFAATMEAYEYAPNPRIAMVEAKPSLPSMKLKRLAIQTIAIIASRALTEPGSKISHKAA